MITQVLCKDCGSIQMQRLHKDIYAKIAQAYICNVYIKHLHAKITPAYIR